MNQHGYPGNDPHYFGQQHLYAQAQAPRAQGNWAAVTGLILGIIALLLAFLPIINNFAFLLALVGLVFGVVGVLRTRHGRRTGRGMGVTSVVLSGLAVVGVLASQAWYAKQLDNVGKSLAEAAPATAQAATAPAPTPTSIPGDGTFLVGDEVTPGTYRSSGAAKRTFSFCSWSRLRDTTGDTGTILQIGSAKVNEPVIVTISRSDGAFKSSGCDNWTKIK